MIDGTLALLIHRTEEAEHLLRKKGVLADGDVKTLRSKPRPAAVASGNPSSAPMASVPPGPGPMIRKAPIEIGGFEITPVGYIALTSVTWATILLGLLAMAGLSVARRRRS